MRKKFNIIIILLTAVVFYNCTDKFEPNISDLSDGEIGNISDTVYIKQSPEWTGFNNPEDMIIGHDGFLYVCDTDNDRIVMMDISGRKLGSFDGIKKPIAIDQDYRLNLIVCAKFDTTINNDVVEFGAVYKIDMYKASHIIENAEAKRILPATSFDLGRPEREYTGVSAFYDNSYYIARKGPKNSNPIDPDNALLVFKNRERNDGSKYDTLVTKVPLLEPKGTGLMSINEVSSLTSFDRGNYDLIITLTGENSFKTQWLKYLQTAEFEGYQSQLEAYSSDLMQVNKFDQPEDVEIDDANNIYVADAEKDSIYKFNSFGDELESFGGSEMFDSPHAVAFHDRTLYVLDTENNRIVRFILSTEID